MTVELVVDKKLALREFTIADAESVFALIDRNRAHLSQHGDTTSQKYPDLESVEESIRTPSNPNKLRLGIWAGETYTGTINLTPEGEIAEIGYYLGKEFGGRGYMTRAVKGLVRFAFEDRNFKSVFARIKRHNVESVRVVVRAGFIQDLRASTLDEYFYVLSSS